MIVKVRDLKVKDVIKADFLTDGKWHFVWQVEHQKEEHKVYLAIEEYGKVNLPEDCEVERKD